jgi:phospholipase/carboxylesterase
MSSGRTYRFGPAHGQDARHLFVFLHGCGATAQSMIPIAFKFQARFPSAALVLPSGFVPGARADDAQDWFSTRGLTADNRQARVAAVLPDVDDLVRREQTNFAVPGRRTVLIGFSQGGTVALEAAKAHRDLASAVVAYGARFATLPLRGEQIDARIHLVHGEFDSVVSRVHAERAARVLQAMRVPVTLDIIEHLGHALTHAAICRGSLRLLQGIYETRRACFDAARRHVTLH